MAVARPGHSRGAVVEPADHMNVVAKRRQRRQARSQAVIGAGLGRNPVALRDTVPVEPEHETVLNWRFSNFTRGGAFRRIGCAGGIEHRDQWRQTDPGATR